MPDDAPQPGVTTLRRARLALEFVALFGGVPLLFVKALELDRAYAGLLIPALIAGGALCLTLLLFDRSFDRRLLWNAAGCRAHLRPILLRFAVAAPALTILVLVLFPESFLGFPRRNPGFWALVMFAYPIFSAFPQEIMFRAFLLHRYAPLFATSTGAIFASAVAFGFGHIILNWVAVALTLVGGALFARTYHRSRSLLAAALEHALYGNLLFTIGFGRFLYLGANG